MDGNDVRDRDHGSHYYGEQDENGIDLSLIRENLKLTPLERIRRAHKAATELIQLRRQGYRELKRMLGPVAAMLTIADDMDRHDRELLTWARLNCRMIGRKVCGPGEMEARR